MKTTELTELGISEEVAAKVLAINGKDIENAKASKDKEIQTITTERDNYKTQMESAQLTLKKFEGIDPEKIQTELASYKKQAEDAAASFKAQIMARDQNDWIKVKLDEYGVKSPLARKQITSELLGGKAGPTWKEGEDGKAGSFFGFDDYMKAAKAEDPSLYLTKEEQEEAEKRKEQEENAPSFTGPTSKPDTKGGNKFKPPLIF